MTFTKDDLSKGRVLHEELNQLLQERIAGKNFEAKLAYRRKSEKLSSFWREHGEEALAALEEARRRIDELEQQIDEAWIHLAKMGGYYCESFPHAVAELVAIAKEFQAQLEEARKENKDWREIAEGVNDVCWGVDSAGETYCLSCDCIGGHSEGCVVARLENAIKVYIRAAEEEGSWIKAPTPRQ